MLCLTISSFPDNASIGVYTEFGQNVLHSVMTQPLLKLLINLSTEIADNRNK